MAAVIAASRTPTPAATEIYRTAVPYLERYESNESLDQAIRLLERAVKADSKSALYFASLADAYRKKSDLKAGDPALLKDAERNAMRALELDPNLAQVHVVMGGVHQARGEADLAQQQYNAALKLDPRNADALSGLAGEFASLKRIAEAEDY